MNDAKPPWVDWRAVRGHPAQAALLFGLLALVVYGLAMAPYGVIRIIVEGRFVESVTSEFLRVLEVFFIGRGWWVGWLFVGLLSLYLLLLTLAWLFTVLRLPFLLADYLEAGTKFYTARSAYYEARRQTTKRVE